jgi:UDP-N-acetyl-D-mannosaminuronic acid dehydrogenase
MGASSGSGGREARRSGRPGRRRGDIYPDSQPAHSSRTSGSQGPARKRRVAVVGLGYVGLPTACILATSGLRVLGVDRNPAVIARLLAGESIPAEPEVNALAKAAVASGNLELSTSVEPADTYIIAVPTPVGDDHRADLGYVESALAEICPLLQRGNLVVLESTVPPGTVRDLVVPAIERSGLRVGADVRVAHCPERVRPGATLLELINNERIIGGIDDQSAVQAAELYSIFVKGRIHRTDATTAEMVKVMENTFRDVNVALANDFAKLAEIVGIDVWEAIRLANNHPRVNILAPGPGVGGHCIPVDPWFLIQMGDEASHVVRAAREVNDAMPAYVVTKLMREADLNGGHVAILGLAYRAELGDIRESPSIAIIARLQAAGVDVRAHDPYIAPDGHAPREDDFVRTVTGADAIVIATDHQMYRDLDPLTIASLVRHRFVLDTRGCLPVDNWARAGFRVVTLGRSV